MVCWGSCAVASALLGSSVMFMLKSGDREDHDRLVGLLNEEQIKTYDFIKRERASLYTTGLILGIVSGILYLRLYRPSGNKYVIDCNFVAIVMSIAGSYYSLMPKTTYMLNHLETPEQVNAWLNVYNEMKNRCHMGMLMGIVALPILSRGVKYIK